MHTFTTQPQANRTTTPARRGLAITELVVALVVLAAIAALAVPRLVRAESHDPAASVRGDLAVLRNAIELYAADHDGSYPPLEGFEAALTRAHNGQGPYLQVIPTPRRDDTSPARTPRIAGFPVAGPQNSVSIIDADWLYDPQTGQVRANALALH